MKTKIVTSLTGETIGGQFTDESGIMQQVIEQTEKGFFRSTKLGRGGLLLKRADFSVAIPLEKLWEFAYNVMPELKPVLPEVETPPMDAEPAPGFGEIGKPPMDAGNQ